MTWNRDVEAAPKQTPVIVTTQNLNSGVTDSGESFRYTSGRWDCEVGGALKVIAWMPMPDPAPLPEDHAKEERGVTDLVIGRIYSAASSNPFDCYRFTAWTDGTHVIKMESSKPDSEDEWWLVVSDAEKRDAIGPMNKERVVWRFAAEISDYLKKTQQEAVFNNLCGHTAFCREAAMYLHGVGREPSGEAPNAAP